MPNVQHKRGSRAALDALAAGNALKAGQVYLISDEGRIAVALTSSTYQALAKQSEGRFEQAIGDGAATSFNVDHNLGTRDVVVEVYRGSGSYDTIIADVARPSVNRVTVAFAAAPTTAAFRVVVRT